jgi:hypothetical protein
MKKILFLDFDGVLHPTSAHAENLFNRASLLNSIIASSHCSIVLSTSWRFTHSLSDLCSLLPKQIASQVIDVTGPAHIGEHARYREILNYLTRFKNQPYDWRALDDSFWEFPIECAELIQCNPNTGLTNKEITTLNNWLV